jgi:hypothetical protein
MEKHFHVRFTQSPREETAGLFRVESFDFSEDGHWEELGYLHIHLRKRDYTFYPSRRWVTERIVPPKTYALSEEEQDRRYRQELLPMGLGNGAYARKCTTSQNAAWPNRKCLRSIPNTQ